MHAFVKTAKLNILLLLVLSVCAVSCAESNEDFAGKLIATFQSKSINKGQMDWAAFSAKVQESARISKDSAIVTALSLNNNPHSWYKRGDLPLKGYYAQRIVNDSCASTGFFNSKLLRDVGYVRVPGFSSDGEYLILTTGFMQDIHGKQYPEGIHPDVLTCSVDQLREQVSNWLYK